ncbi:CocE/NonD family hydrolase [Candidatus Sumerlaeota bacterium]|nr:CocE/NonD family hydrolase [Candidatus Sumerlaeota bacterium]
MRNIFCVGRLQPAPQLPPASAGGLKAGQKHRARFSAASRIALAILLAVFCSISLAVSAEDQPKQETDKGSGKDYMVPMRDGVKLATTVYAPAGEGKWPVILMRTPYNKEMGKGMSKGVNEKGYVLVVQDCRGRFKSEGEYVPFRTDAEDGYDTIEWAAAQEWSNGKIGMSGGSALGITTNLAATAAPPHLVCGYVVVAPTSWRNEALHLNGLYRKEMIDGWMKAMNSDEVRKEWEKTPIMDHYWDWIEIRDKHDKIQIPMYNVGGWFDIFQKGSITNFVGLQDHGGGKAKGNQKLLMAAAGHGPFGSRFKTFPNDGGDMRGDDQFRWFDYWLKGEKNGIMDEPPIRYFLMGDAEDKNAPGNTWMSASHWPPESKTASYYIHDGGMLSTETPAGDAESVTRFAYDPKNPAKNVGGQNLVIPKGPMDQREIGERPDYFRFNTAPLAEPLTVVGPVKVELWVETDAPDTDFIAKLVDVYPDGYEALLDDQGLRLRYRQGFDKEVMMTPGKVEKIEIDLWSTAMVFNKGHKIGLHVTSSADTRFDPNPNTGHPLRADDETRVANNAFHHDANHPSRVLLPVVELGKLQKAK